MTELEAVRECERFRHDKASAFAVPGADDSTAWWAEFIEHWAARGVDRRELNAAVVKFRAAQESLSRAINS